MAITWQRRVVPGRCVGTLTCCWISRAWSLGEPRGYDDGRRVVRVVVPMGGAAARALVACCERVELCPRRELGVCQYLGPAGVLMLR